jgi:hypothetical protein
MYRTQRALKSMLNTAPFEEPASDPDAKHYVAFLDRKPRAKPTLPLRNPREGLEAVALRSRDVFIISRKKKMADTASQTISSKKSSVLRRPAETGPR